MKWAGYIRVSDGPQVPTHSLPAQDEAIRRFVGARDGILVRIYEDHYSARQADHRTQFLAMIEDAHAGRFEVIVVHKHDRFARNRRDAVVYKALLKRLGIHVYSVLEPSDPEAPTSVLFEGMLEVFAEYFSANLAQEVRKGLARRASLGLQVGAAPFGYRLAGGGLTPTEDLAVARLVLETYLSGTVTDMDVVRMLHARGLVQRRPDGTVVRFSRDTVRSVLTSPVYAGLVRYRGQLLAGQHEAVITPVQHEAILALRRRFFRAPRANRRSPRSYPFAGLVQCAGCGGG